ncbi:MAG TPA: hypothetical protein DFR83_05880 [Deltaproteobacteria bacterium]|nr:hypothetical protein [Deltaproteobacteria bacterium]
MREDSEIVPLQSWPARDDAVARLPDSLSPERMAKWPVVLRSHGIDETGITLMDVQRDPLDAAVCVQRQHWLFDEDSRTWVLERNDEWWLPPEGADQLATLLRP